jgi:N-acetylneuraminic acid mutarotase
VKKHLLVGVFLGALLAASAGGAATRPYPGSVSWADARHGWAPHGGKWCKNTLRGSGEGVVCATEDGGRTWRTIFVGGNFIFAAVRTSVSAGLVSTGAHGHVQFWTRDNGRHWYGTEVAGGSGGFNARFPAFAGKGSQLYWVRAFEDTVYQVTPWPPSGPATCDGRWARSAFDQADVDPAGNHCQGSPVEAGMQSVPVVSGHGVVARFAVVPGGLFVLTQQPDGTLMSVVHRGGSNQVTELPAAAVPAGGSGGLRRLRLAWPAVTVEARYFVGDRAKDSWDIEWRSSDGGATWSVQVTQAWSEHSQNPFARAGVAFGTLGDEVVLAGGRLTTFRPGPGSSPDTSRLVQAYRPADDSWRRLADLPAAVGYPAGAAADGAFYVVGGFDRNRKPQRHAFVLRGGAWSRLPPLPEPRAAAGAAVVGGRLYVVGGIGPAGLARNALVLDLRSGRWTTAPGPRPRAYLGVAAAGGRIVALGGRVKGAATSLTLAESWRPGDRRWRRLPALPSRRSETVAVAVGDAVVSLGGAVTEYYLPVASTALLEPGGTNWRRLPDLRTPRYGLAAAVLEGRLYALVGGDGDGPTDRGTLSESLLLGP